MNLHRTLAPLAAGLVVGLLLAPACKAGDSQAKRAAAADDTAPEPTRAPAPPAPPSAPGAVAAAGASLAATPPATPSDPRKIIRTGAVRLEVEHYAEARQKLEALVSQAGGFVASSEAERSEGQVSAGTLVVRVPAEGFGGLIASLAKLGTVLDESTKSEDVSEEFVDLAAREKSAQQLEARLLQLAAERTTGVPDVLAVERELARVRGEIEQLEGRLRYLDHSAALSTLQIQLTTRAPEIAAAPTVTPSWHQRAGEAFARSVDGFAAFCQGLLLLLVSLVPWLPLGGLVALVAWRWRRAHSPLK